MNSEQVEHAIDYYTRLRDELNDHIEDLKALLPQVREKEQILILNLN